MRTDTGDGKRRRGREGRERNGNRKERNVGEEEGKEKTASVGGGNEVKGMKRTWIVYSKDK